VARWAEFFQVSRSGYYSCVEGREERLVEKEAVKADIRQIFEGSEGTYGPGRICGMFRRTGRKLSYGRASEYMAEMGLSSSYNRHKRQRSLTDSRNARGDGYTNLVRNQSFLLPYQAVCSDITYLKSGEGWLYMCVVKDIVTGSILGTATAESMRKELAIQAFLNAQARHHLGEGTIFHSDRGSQYTSHEFMETLKKYKVRQSFSRVGMPGDNAWAESFFATLKKERVHSRHFATREELRQTVFAWTEGFYNTRRIQARLGYMSPREYSAKLVREGKAA